MAANASAQTAAAVPGLDLIAARHERRLTRPPQWLTSLSITVAALVTSCRPPFDDDASQARKTVERIW